ncbi:uncharacterized protein FMAN_07042 [Fusarium mangiferae]|uniref:Uncharacterized protein n=1 Tax=Fusarium mangiferae TaxID=192010 RepID=A0A1L7T907_FUSMA|nr:uncharacterized protein FMAN_07042 [Fusarium mangiferae]CVK92025.1 uncharacterized protein FMAN_07042 [Fusarium mangiferae]
MSSQFVGAGWPIDPRSQRFIFDEATEKIFNQEHDQAVTKRLQNNNVQKYDDVIAISEETLNATLRLRYSNLLKKKKDNRLREFRHVIPSFGVMKAELASPHIQLVASGNGGETVQFFVNFRSGTFVWWSGSSPDDFQKFIQKVDGWSIALNVNFNEKKLAQTPDPIQKQISTIAPGSYSVSQIILTLSNASVASINWDASNLPATPDVKTKRDMYDIVLAAFKRFFEQYITWLGRGPYSVLGYTIKVNKTADNQLPSEFQPTAVFLRTQIYTPCTQEFKDQFPNTKRPIRGGLDALMFLQMTGNKALPEPRDYDDSLPVNWVTGKVDCSMTMSKAVFWDAYLADRFSEFNLQALSIANDIWWWIRTDGRGLDNPWKLTEKGKPSTAWWRPTDKGAIFDWEAPGGRKIGDREYDSWHAFVGNYMKWKPGSDEVEISMLLNSMRRVEYDGGMFQNIVELKWSLKLRLNTIKDGKLETVITADSPKVTSKQINDNSRQWWRMGDDDMREFEKKTEESVTEALAKRDFTKDLSAILNDRSKFVFPGAGEFAMREPKFNDRGDLQLDLRFKGDEIVVDNTFHLIVNAEGLPYHKQWVKVVTIDTQTWKAVLVKDQWEGTEFQLSDGNLVVDVEGMPSGPRARPEDSESESVMRQVVFDSLDGVKCEFSITGSEVTFSRNDGRTWNRRFYIKDGSLGFLFGEPGPYDEDADQFMLDAVY